MNRREKMLLFGLIGAVVLWQGASVVDAVFFAPATERADRIRNLESELGKKKLRERELQIAQSKLKNWSKRSLPPDPLLAATLYQNWLIDLGNKSKLTSVRVTPVKRTEPKPKGGTYYTVSVNIVARGTVTNFCNFLYDFHQSGLLHRMTRITVATQQHEGNPSLELNMSCDALALTSAPARTTLFPQGKSGDEKLNPDPPLRPLAEYLALSDRNLFVRGYNGPPREPTRPRDPTPTKTTPRPADSLDPAEFTYMVAGISSAAEREIWLFDRSNDKYTILSEGTEFSIGDLKGRVIVVHNDYIQVLVDGEMWELDLGKNLRQMRKLPSSAKGEKK